MRTVLLGSLPVLYLLCSASQAHANVPHFYYWSDPTDRPIFLTYGAIAFGYVGVMLLIFNSLFRGAMGATRALALGLSVSLFFVISPCLFTILRGGESVDNRFVGGEIMSLGPAGIGMSLALLCGGCFLLRRFRSPR